MRKQLIFNCLYQTPPQYFHTIEGVIYFKNQVLKNYKKRCKFVSKYKIMTTLTLRLQLDENLVSAYRQAKPEEKEDLKNLFQRLLTNKFRKREIEDMIQRMDDIGNEAQENGLTEDMIDEILSES
jgi:hypothetical protein